MIDDKDIQYNMALYMGLMERKYQTVKQKRKQLQMIIFQAAARIQRSFRRYLLKRNTRHSIKIQRWWRKYLQRYCERKIKMHKFKMFFYGLIITRFFVSKFKNMKVGQIYSKQKIKMRTKSSLTRITYYFPDYVCRKSALHAEIKYINKYRQYLRHNFESEWQKYEVKLTKELWKQIGRKWVKVDSKQKKQKKVYLTEQDKQIDGQEYINNKLNKMYEQQHRKMEVTDTNLKNNQNELMLAIQRLQIKYKQKILHL